MIKITSDQWDLYTKKYSRLMWKIAHRISGDTMLASIEDNYSDLCIAAIESINGFHKKTGKSFDEMITMKLFDQYTKTCLWTAKARKGVKLTERMPFRNKHLSIDCGNLVPHLVNSEGETKFDIEDKSSNLRFTRIDARDMCKSYNSDLNKLIKFLEDDPTLMTENGDIKVYPLADLMEKPASSVKKLLKIMEDRNDPNK